MIAYRKGRFVSRSCDLPVTLLVRVGYRVGIGYATEAMKQNMVKSWCSQEGRRKEDGLWRA